MAATHKIGLGNLLGGAISGAVIGLIAAAQPLYALEISRHLNDSPSVNAILLKGKIEYEDTFRLQRYIANLPTKNNIVVYLDSPGGNLREGLKLGYFFYQSNIETVVDAKMYCTSACAIAFLGGRESSGKPKRTKYSSARLGFHSFTRDFDGDRNYSAEDMKQAIYAAQATLLSMIDYLRMMEANHDFLRIMLRSSPNEMHYLSNDHAVLLGISVWDEKNGCLIDSQLVTDCLNRSRS